ncbi:MAG TPA: ArsA family ATPase [Jatrophihabitans sp.]|nr:ArsA family ATPase [Jatrophihabitans sp.]
MSAVRILLFTGKGGVGKTTLASATALRLADRGVKTLLLSTDAAHSLADALGHSLAGRPLSGEPTPVAPGLDAVQLDGQHRLEAGWADIESYLRRFLSQGGVDPVTADELTVLPGLEEVLALLAVRELAAAGRWDALVLDCAPTAETLRLLALPEAFGWYLHRVFPVHRRLARGMRPVSALLGRPDSLPPDAVFDAVVRLAGELAEVRALLADPAATSVRLVLTPEAVVTAEARRTYTALALYGYQVDEVLVNRVFPTAERDGSAERDVSAGQDGSAGLARQDRSAGQHGSSWQHGWVQAQRRQLAAIEESFAGLTVRTVGYRPAEPVGSEPLRSVAEELYGQLPGTDPATAAPAGQSLSVRAVGELEFELTLPLPLAERSEVAASRSGDELIVTVAGHRRILALPSVLRRCRVTGGSVSDGRLRLLFEPDPALWPA